MKNIVIFFFSLCVATSAVAQIQYPYPLHSFKTTAEGKPVEMMYMDVAPVGKANGKTLLLFHGKNFSGYYWKEIIPQLTSDGYRVIVPDQPGFGRSSKPDIHYSFHLLALINKRLLDSLKIERVSVIGHSMGGMLAGRFTLLYPKMVEKLVLENPIGLEDYKTFVPYQPIDSLYAKEKAATYESYKKYQQSYYPMWKEEYEQYVNAQAEVLKDSAFPKIAFVNALTYQMIYEQPVIYELSKIKCPVLLIIGQEDRTVVGKDKLNEQQKSLYGQYPALGKKVKALIPAAVLAELPGIGHIPHIQDKELFLKKLLPFL